MIPDRLPRLCLWQPSMDFGLNAKKLMKSAGPYKDESLMIHCFLTTILRYIWESETHVLYVLKAALDAVKFGLCSGISQLLCPVFSIGSSVGGLSTK